ncbi:MAG TPA: DoxX family protein [Bacteroidia bacterium]
MIKRKKVMYWVATIWLSLGMVVTGAGQLIKMKEGQGGLEMISHLGYPAYFMTLLGAWKVLGVVAVLVPKFPLLKEWAYAGFFFLTTGAMFSHISSGDPFTSLLPSLLLLVLTVASWYLRPVERKVSLTRN